MCYDPRRLAIQELLDALQVFVLEIESRRRDAAARDVNKLAEADSRVLKAVRVIVEMLKRAPASQACGQD